MIKRLSYGHRLCRAQTRLAELQALFAAANEEEFEDNDDTGVLPSDEVKSKKDDLKAANAEWKAQLKLLKSLAGNLYTELQALPKPPPDMQKKSYYCTEGFSQKDPPVYQRSAHRGTSSPGRLCQ